jgi:gliding motility associated protien GldN
MNWRNLLSVVVCLGGSITISAQSNLLNAKVPTEIGLKSAAQLLKDNDKPLEYGYVDDRDILMSKKTWELIDLDERINFPLYYPIDTMAIGNERRSLYDVLLKGIKTGKITEVYADSYFKEKRTLKDMEQSFKRVDTTDAGREQMNEDIDAYRTRIVQRKVVTGRGKNKVTTMVTDTIKPSKTISQEFINTTEIASLDVSDYRIVGLWYFDKRQSDLRYRILGICPVIPDVYTMGKTGSEVEYVDLFWVFYPGAREVLHEWKAFNEKNSSMPISFDHLLNSRRFNAMVYKEENVYNDREISDYMKDNALMQLIESNRVKDKVRNFEQDMWNY